MSKLIKWFRLKILTQSEYKPWIKSGEDYVVVDTDAVFFVRWYYLICIKLIKKPITYWLRDSYHAIPILWIFLWFYLGSVFGTSCINKVQVFVLMLLSHLFW